MPLLRELISDIDQKDGRWKRPKSNSIRVRQKLRPAGDDDLVTVGDSSRTSFFKGN